MKKYILSFMQFVILAFGLLACRASNSVQLAPEMLASMRASADQYDLEFPGNDMNIARLCAETPTALYWNEQYQTWAVTCVLPLPNTYGYVMLDTSYKILNTKHINAVSQSAIDDLIGSVGWVRK